MRRSGVFPYLLTVFNGTDCVHGNIISSLRSADEIVEGIIRRSVVDSDDFRGAVQEVLSDVLNMKMGGKGKAKRT